MEFTWFAICTTLAFIPLSSGEEKLLYQTPFENDWGGWATLPRTSSNVIILIVFVPFFVCLSFPLPCYFTFGSLDSFYEVALL